MTAPASTERVVGRAPETNGRLRAATDGTVRHYFETLLERLNWPGHDSAHLLRTLGVTSCRRGEGVSSVAAHLALAAAGRHDHRVLLIDANLARPSAQRTFPVALSPGFAEAVREGMDPQKTIRRHAAERLAVMPAGRIGADRDRMFDRQKLSNLLVALREHFDLIVFDLPPAIHDDPAIHLATLLDGVLLVVQAGRVDRTIARRTVASLQRAGVQLAGAVLNQH